MLEVWRLVRVTPPADISNPTRSSELPSTYRATLSPWCVALIDVKAAILRPGRIKLDSSMVGDTTNTENPESHLGTVLERYSGSVEFANWPNAKMDVLALTTYFRMMSIKTPNIRYFDDMHTDRRRNREMTSCL